MMKRPIRTGFVALAVLFVMGAITTPKARMQDQRTLAGEWLVKSTPINNEMFSRKSNTLGFPDRDMFFEENGEIRTGFVAREDVGTNIKPLGVWRLDGNRFSATFQLWCPNTETACGTIIMRGEFVRADRIRGTMTAFFDVPDEERPTGYDTWRFSFTGDRIGGGGQ